MQAQVVTDEARLTVDTLRRDLEIEREAREREGAELHVEQEKCNTLQSVLEDFQAGMSAHSFTLRSNILMIK